MTITRFSALIAIICALFVSSCANTVRGVAHDMKKTRPTLWKMLCNKIKKPGAGPGLFNH